MGLGLFYIVFGLAICLSLAVVSEWRLSNGSIFIHEDCELGLRIRFGPDVLQELVKIAEERNDDTLVLRHAAVTAEDVQKSAHRYFRAAKQSMLKDELLYAFGAASEKICPDAKSMVARSLYELWVKNGDLKIATGVTNFLKKNNAVLLDDLDGGLMGGAVMLLSGQGEHLQSIVGTFSPSNAVLLLSLLNGSIKVMQC